QAHELFVGDLTVDLADAPLPDVGVTEIEASVGLGDLHVVVPRDAVVEVDATSRAGDLAVPDSADLGARRGRPSLTERGGGRIGVDETFTLGGATDGPRLDLVLSTGVGDIEV